MSAIDQLLASGGDPNSVGGLQFIDADTIRNPDDPEGKGFRLQGYDAPEIQRFTEEGKLYKQGTAGGGVATGAITALARKQGFTEIHKTGAVDPNGREIIELRDKNGRNFTTELLSSGVLSAGQYTTQDDLDAIEVARVFGERASKEADPQWADAAQKVTAGIAAEGYKDLYFKQQALNEVQRAYAPGQFTDAVAFRHTDRTIDNDSLNPFSDAWDQGWLGVQESAYGTINMLGETAGNELLADIGTAGRERAMTNIQQYGNILTDWKEVKDIGTAFDYVTNNAALSLPYMAISIGGAAAAPLTGGLSLAAPASVYAGQTWNEMEGEKNAGVAVASGVAQAALDRLGLGFIVGKVGKTGGTKLLEEGVEALVARGVGREAAKQQVMTATRKELAGFVGDAATIARQQITAKNTFKKLAGGTALGSAGEGVTEALQESVGYLGAVYGSDKAFDWSELQERALAGAIAGAALGGAFSVPGSLYDVGAWADVAVRQAPADVARQSRDTQYEQEAIQQEGRVTSNQENATNFAVRARNNADLVSLEERVDAHKTRQGARTLGDQIFEAVTSAPALWQGATRYIFQPELLDRSVSLRKLKDMLGGGLQKTYSGATFENQKHHNVTIYKNMVDIPDRVFANFNDGKKAGRKQKEAISNEIYNTINGATDADGNFNPDLVPDGPRKQQIIMLQQQLQRLSDKMHSDQAVYNPELGYQKNYLTTYKSFDKGAIYRQRPQFVAALLDEFPSMTNAEANNIVDAITSNDNINDFSEVLDATQAAGRPGSHRRRSLDLAQREAFQPFMERDLFQNINNATKSAARYTAHQQFLGQNNEVIAQALADAQAEGIDPATVNKIAAQLNNYLLAESGNYKRATSDVGKRLERIQKNFMMVSTLAGLPLATISSFVEAALTMRGLTIDQVMGKGNKPGGLFALGNELGHTMWTGMGEIVGLADKKQRYPAATKGKEVLKNLGFYEWDVGAATTTGVTETNPWQQNIYEQFFKWTGLQGWTNYTRAVRGSIAGDYIMDKMQILLEADPENYTNEDQEAREGLRNLGINVDAMLNAYQGNGMFDPNQASVIEENFREGMFNFINDAVALPQSANRPLIYQDPRFALFTQFQGFIATFTANHIPKLWGEYVKRGTPAMKYNAFAVMATMIMLGFASQYLKDLIKFGKTPAQMGFGPEDHPFLSPSEFIQRGVRASGLLGTGERVLDQFFPIYDQQSDNPGEWAFNTVAGEAPSLGFVQKGAKGAGALLQGDVGTAAKEGARFLPGFGVMNFVRDHAQELGNNWNFRGG